MPSARSRAESCRCLLTNSRTPSVPNSISSDDIISAAPSVIKITSSCGARGSGTPQSQHLRTIPVAGLSSRAHHRSCQAVHHEPWNVSCADTRHWQRHLRCPRCDDAGGGLSQSGVYGGDNVFHSKYDLASKHSGLSQNEWITGLGNSGTVVSGPEMIQMIYTISRNLPTDGKNEFTLVLLAHHCSCNADVVPGLCLRLE